MSRIEIHMTLPKEMLAIAQCGKEEIAAEMPRLLLIERIRQGRVPYDKAVKHLGISQAKFLAYMVKHQVSPLQFTPGEVSMDWNLSRKYCFQ